MNSEFDEADRLKFARSEWAIPAGVHYLNHGSFGPTPRTVLQAREELQREHAANPMDFFLRRMESLLDSSAEVLSKFIRCPPENLIFLPNSTSAMNVVAENLPLQAGDEVLLTDHEYGAVIRIWGTYCRDAGAKTVMARLPFPLGSSDEIVEAIFSKATARTRILVVSHVTSPTAAILPIQQICKRARELGILTCVDGPHAIAMLDVDVRSLDCDFYAASCHKWLCAPFGSGFLYVRSRFKQGLKPNMISWGRSLMGRPPSWKDEFHWPGTCDPTPWLSVPSAIQLMEQYGTSRFRTEMNQLCRHVRDLLLEIPGSSPVVKDSLDETGTMVSIRLPVSQHDDAPNQPHPLQTWLWKREKIEIPVVRWGEGVLLRASCHLYNSAEQYKLLRDAVMTWITEEDC